MTITIEDAWFTAGAKIRVDRGTGELAFRHCSFEGCDIFIAAEIDEMIFVHCVFRGTTFTGQPLSSRIARDCQTPLADIEMAGTGPETVAPGRFRR